MAYPLFRSVRPAPRADRENPVSRLSLFLTSLVAAIPGGILAALMVMTIVSNFNEMPTLFTVLASLVLAVSAFVTVLPLGILIFGPRQPGEPREEKELAAVEAAEADDLAAVEGLDAGEGDDFATAEIEIDDEFPDEEFNEDESL